MGWFSRKKTGAPEARSLDYYYKSKMDISKFDGSETLEVYLCNWFNWFSDINILEELENNLNLATKIDFSEYKLQTKFDRYEHQIIESYNVSLYGCDLNHLYKIFECIQTRYPVLLFKFSNGEYLLNVFSLENGSVILGEDFILSTYPFTKVYFFSLSLNDLECGYKQRKIDELKELAQGLTEEEIKKGLNIR